MAHLVDRKFGAYYPTNNTFNGDLQYNFDYLESQVGRKFDTYSTFIEMDSDYPGNPTPPATRKRHSEIAVAASKGHDILLALHPIVAYVNDGTGTYRPQYATYAQIRAGTYDNMLTAMVTWLLGLGVDIIVRWCWEMNLPSSAWYPGAAASATYQSGKWLTTTGLPVCTDVNEFIQTWQYLTTLLRSLPNASRLKMYYCPNAQESTAAQGLGYTVEGMFPGTSYVDIVGYDIYNGLGNIYHSPLDTMRGPRENDSTHPWAYDILTGLHPTAKVWIGETSCVDLNDSKDTAHLATGHSKAQWYTDLFAIADDLPQLECINFFNTPGTRTTWPFNSSSTALSGFIDGFNFDSNATQHGVVADTYVPSAGPPFDATGIGFPLPANHLPGQPNRTAYINKIEFLLNQIASINASWVGINANSDGSVASISANAQSVGTASMPVIKVATPGGTAKSILGVKTGTNTYDNFRIRDDGRLNWGPGDTGNIDTALYRSSANALTTDGALTVAGVLTVSGAFHPSTIPLPNQSSSPSSPGATNGVVVYSLGDSFKIRNVGFNWVVAPAIAEMHKQLLAFDPVVATSAVTVTAGAVYVIKMTVPDARTVTKVGFYVQAAGASLTNCYAGLYDASGTLLGNSTDQSTTFQSTGEKQITISAVTSLAIEPGYYYIALIVNTSNTLPTFAGSLAGPINWNLSATQARFLSIGTGQTALPGTLIYGNGAVLTKAIFAALS